MDFAICPSCGQSVLDDEAADCPFCGASMKAKPGAKPAAPAAKAPPAAPSKAPAKAGGKAAAQPGDDFPFDAEVTAAAAAVAATAAPTKGRTLKVVCPMCETAGYVPESAAGKNVKCANAKCLVPVFTAPAPQAKAAAPAPPKPKRSLLLVGLATLLIVGGGGGLAYYFSLPKPSESLTAADGLLTPEKIKAMREKSARSDAGGATTGAADATQTKSTQTPAETTPKETAKSLDPAQMIAESLQLLDREALKTGAQNRSKPYCRRMAAEAFALAGNLQGAREQIDSLTKVGADLPFYRVTPWVEIFWQERAAGRAAAAQQALDQAVSNSTKLPKLGIDQLDVATRLAVALCVAGRAAEARDLLALHQSAGLDGELAACTSWLTADPGLTDFALLIDLRPAVPRKTPQFAAAASVLVLLGHPDVAREFIALLPDAEAQTEAAAAWVEAQLWKNPAGDAAAIVGAASAKLSPAAQALLWARAARILSARQQTDGALAALKQAGELLAALEPPTEFVLPELKTLMRWKPQPVAPLSEQAAAALEFAVAQQTIAKDADQAAAAVERAVKFARGIGPATPAIRQKLEEADREGPTGLRDRLKQQLELRTNDDARQATGVYRRLLGDLNTLAQTRFNLQTTMLERAIAWNLADAVWKTVSERSQTTDLDQQEPYLTTDVPAMLIESFRARGAADLEKAVAAAVGKAVARPALAQFTELMTQGRYREAAQGLSSTAFKADQRETLALLWAGRLAQGATPEPAWQFGGALTDISLREQCWELAALIATRRQQADAVWKQASFVQGATEKSALYRSLVAGLREAAR